MRIYCCHIWKGYDCWDLTGKKASLPAWAQGTDVLRAYGKLRVVHGAKVQFACSPHCPLLFWAAPRPSLQFPGLYLPAHYTGLDLPGGALCILRKLYSSGHCSSYQATKMTTSGGEKFRRHINTISFLSWMKPHFVLQITITSFGNILGRFYSLTLFLGLLPTPK